MFWDWLRYDEESAGRFHFARRSDIVRRCESSSSYWRRVSSRKTSSSNSSSSVDVRCFCWGDGVASAGVGGTGRFRVLPLVPMGYGREMWAWFPPVLGGPHTYRGGLEALVMETWIHVSVTWSKTLEYCFNKSSSTTQIVQWRFITWFMLFVQFDFVRLVSHSYLQFVIGWLKIVF